MKTKAVRIYGKKDLRLEEFELPAMKDDEILAQVISDSICMSSHKAAIQGADHKRVPDDIHINPTMIGHEFAGVILEVGNKWKDRFSAGQKFSIQPAMNHMGTLNAPGYSYRFIGGDATHIIIPSIVMEANCLLPYDGEAFFPASLSEPMSCIVGAFHASYHIPPGTYNHEMGIRRRGKMAILAGVGPMGLGAIDYALHQERKPGLLVVTDIDDNRLARAACLFTPEHAAKEGVKLMYVNTGKMNNPVKHLRELTDGTGFDDVFIFAPVKNVVEQGDCILGFDGCLNFFAGPTNPEFRAEFNFYNVHYAFTHIAGTSGGNTDDMLESLKLMGEGKINPAIMITHIGGLDAVVDTTMNLPQIPGGKKLIYTNISMPLVSLYKLGEMGRDNILYAGLHEIVSKNDYIWSFEAEKYLLANAKSI
ncbi:MAG: L-sorbose 1-phosphate reductase [Bacteroidetes bacterium GWE2_41_25]|nr:MAG: L-sorbose 1-phosphate reductase [Bacteroidetes bacterium GWA2_40_15]OFX99559.1 MAG: L-sorbose 1-phosphate reductase [Bacteroidetes bacterium GWC2_40_22]OFY11698.1 MAG: L-sorbose 1-phosphate reductase [Bacteroidetes bacterium GWE2_41_25]OFY58967.1 MAG: L-sorbose 1-phosphate reductase [Bacteroidetes bacterium GWF2_41_9]HAM09885.1 L-sorbose 1-phosphate reductase [Bacteroidales bacterium]